jgi:hypothetical protein
VLDLSLLIVVGVTLGFVVFARGARVPALGGALCGVLGALSLMATPMIHLRSIVIAAVISPAIVLTAVVVVTARLHASRRSQYTPPQSHE